MHTFISHLCDSIMAIKRPLHEVNIVVPARRAALFIKKELASRYSLPFIAPHICTIEDLAQDISHLTRATMTTLLFEFYATYRQYTGGDKCDTFDVFIRWAPTLLSDYNEIDRYMLSPDAVFATLKDVERIEGWNLEMPLSPLMQTHKKFWQMGEELYHAFKERLLSQGIGYSGMIFRRAAENAARSAAFINDDKFWIFAGLNAMSRSEESIISCYVKEKNARLLYQCDDYYMNECHSAGLFLRRLKNNAVLGRDFMWQMSEMCERKNLEIISVTRTVSQSRAVASVIENLIDRKEGLEDTAVVLADEKQLVPMLSSLPSSVDSVNVTMGYPLSMLPAAGWAESMMDMYTTAVRLRLKGYYHKDISRLLSHSLVAKWLKKDGRDYSSIVQSYIIEANAVDFTLDGFYNWYSFKYKKSPIPEPIILRMNLLMEKIEPIPQLCCKRMIDILSSMRNISELYDDMSMEYIYHTHEIFSMLSGYMERYNYVENVSTLRMLYHQLGGGHTVDFYGEPLKGLQVMGLLETRLLNFKNVIISGVNEGVLPATRGDNSFIPHDVKRYYGLPTNSEKDAIYSYHFFRLLQGAENITLIYDADESTMGVMEPSRYVQQLKHDMASMWDIKEVVMNSTAGKLPERNVRKDKTPYAVNRTRTILEKGLSASAICSYMSCPMDFYYRRVLEMGDVETVDESAAANTMGSIVHRVLQSLYTPFISCYIDAESIEKMKLWAEKEIKNAFDELLVGRTYSTGSNYLAYQAVRRLVYNYLDVQKKEIEDGAKVYVVALEEKLETTLDVDGVKVRLYGIADRIDMYDGVLRVIDYKTGRVEKKDMKIDDMELLRSSYVDEGGVEHLFSQGKSMQLLFYAYIYMQMMKEKGENIDSVRVGIESLRKPGEGTMMLTLDGREDISLDDMEKYEERIKGVIREMMDKDVPYLELGAIYYDILS